MPTKAKKIFCAVETVDYHTNRYQFEKLYDAWGQFCDKIIGFSNSTRLAHTVNLRNNGN